MAFDSSGILAAKAPDILPMIQGVQAYKNALAANPGIAAASAEAQGSLRAKQAYGNALQANTGPDGNINYSNALAQTAQNPDASLGMGEIANQNIEQQTGTANTGTAQAQYTQAQIEAAKAHVQMVAPIATALLAKAGPDGKPALLNTKDVTSSIAGVLQNTTLPPDLKNAFLQDGKDFASQLGPAPDPADPSYAIKAAAQDAAIRSKLKQLVIQGQVAPQQVQEEFGAPRTLNNGAAQVGITQDLFTGAIKNSDTGVVNQVTPGQKMERNSVTDPVTGITSSVPNAAIADAFGNPKGPNNGALPTSISPQAQALQGVSAQRAHAISDAASGAPGRIAAMQSVRSLVNGAPSTAFGPTSDLTSTAQKIASAFGINTPELTKGQVSVEGMNKLFASIAAQQGVATGAGTDASRALIHDANPSLANSKAGMLENLAIVQGNEQYGIAKNRALQQYLSKNPSGNVQSFESTFNNSVSPLAFQFQNLDPAGRQRLFNSLSGKEIGVDPVTKEPIYNGDKGRLQSSWAQANKRGWFEGQ